MARVMIDGISYRYYHTRKSAGMIDQGNNSKDWKNGGKWKVICQTVSCQPGFTDNGMLDRKHITVVRAKKGTRVG
jgi:hypothetical protein